MLRVLLSLWNVMRKEFAQTLRDRRMVFMLLAAPAIQLVAFGYAIDYDVDRIPTVVCDQDRTRESRDLIQRFLASRTFSGRGEVADPEAAQRALETGDAAVALIVPRGYALRIGRRAAASAQVLIDGTDSTRAQVAASAASQFLQIPAVGGAGPAPIRGPAGPTLVPRILYNQSLSSPVYMLPGIAGSLLLNVTAIITAMGLARERETGTLEQILVTPMHPAVLLAGKCLPFAFFGLVDIIAVLVLGSLIFDVPIRGSLAVIGLGSFFYLIATLGMGILLATISASQQQAILGAFSFMLPAMLLSGFMSPIDSMPAWLQPLTNLNPMRHFLEIMRRCLLKGAGIRDLLKPLGSLLVLGLGILGLAVARFHKRLA